MQVPCIYIAILLICYDMVSSSFITIILLDG